jgi:hypothetical protein
MSRSRYHCSLCLSISPASENRKTKPRDHHCGFQWFIRASQEYNSTSYYATTTSHHTSHITLNYWVMHPVARVSIKYWNNLRTQQSIFFLVLDFIVHFSHCRQHLQHTHQNLHTTDRAKKPVINT